jgi:hypothetical protein
VRASPCARRRATRSPWGLLGDTPLLHGAGLSGLALLAFTLHCVIVLDNASVLFPHGLRAILALLPPFVPCADVVSRTAADDTQFERYLGGGSGTMLAQYINR